MEGPQGSNFEFNMIASLRQMFEIEKRRTIACHPQTDGLKGLLVF